MKNILHFFATVTIAFFWKNILKRENAISNIYSRIFALMLELE